MLRGSLATKCLVLFGSAIVLIVLGALVFPWLRMNALIDAGQLEVSRHLVAAWARDDMGETGGAVEHAGIVARRLTPEEAVGQAAQDPFVGRALTALGGDARASDYQEARWAWLEREYRYASASRRLSGELDSIVVLERRSLQASRLLILNSVYLSWAGLIVIALALPVFYLITRKLVLRPVRRLTRAAELVRQGNLTIRADITTGDEFEQLAETINSMLGDLRTSDERLRAINAALDLRLTELAENNSALYEAAKLKGEFLANVSHELRTPLNSIIGFTELLMEMAKADAAGVEAGGTAHKRVRYLENIQTGGRNLLGLIDSLLELARIEAGRVEMHIEPMSLKSACEGLVGLIYPLAQRQGVEVKLDVPDDLPLVETDVRKFQQVIFNFLSNAVKFTRPREATGRAPTVALRAERLRGEEERVRVSVIDNGPGIPREEQDRVFEKFYQLDRGHTRRHEGTGLGLAISKELASLLHAEIQLESEVGRGSMFSLILPLSIKGMPAAESRLEARFRAALAGRREFE
ncbi:MAG: HAMP domain-containing histidine kinase [Phycisphaerales bacterium]|nr:HAMP domain-containing histidine kinase [Phycisphaerales bacterium]